MPDRMCVCPFCGAEISVRAKACPQCGSDEKTGWSDSTYLDGIDIPDASQYEEIRENEFNSGKEKSHWKWITGALLLLLISLYFIHTGIKW